MNKTNIKKLYSLTHTDNFDLSKNTTYGLGGMCRAAFYPKTEEEAIAAYCELKSSGEKFFVLGRGSNMLVSDRFYDGYVICTSKLKGIFLTGENQLTCLSGTTVSELMNFTRKNGFSGTEFLAGIPASVGGLTFMNGGAGGKYISDICESVTVFSDKLHVFDNSACDFGYKHSIMRDINCFILSTTLTVETSTCEKVTQNISKYLHARLSIPHGKSCGCVFKNPQGLSAGKLVEECGLKGFGIGGAKVSPEHANFIINCGGSADNVYRTIKFVKEKVYEKFGVLLEEEVVYIGDFNDSYG